MGRTGRADAGKEREKGTQRKKKKEKKGRRRRLFTPNRPECDETRGEKEEREGAGSQAAAERWMLWVDKSRLAPVVRRKKKNPLPGKYYSHVLCLKVYYNTTYYPIMILPLP